MTIINVSPNRLVQIGYEGEDKVTILRFSYSDKWLENGDGIFTVRVLRNGENKAYDAQLIKDDRENLIIDMTVTDIELSKEGYGEMQLVYTGADFVKKSSVYKYYVSRSVDEPVDPPAQDVYTQIIESLSDLQTDVQGLSDAVEDIGDISLLTTMAKTDLVSAINEVNEHGGGSDITVDDALSDASTNPVQNKVITSALAGKADKSLVDVLTDDVADVKTDTGALKTAVQSKADAATVSALSDAVNDLDSDVQGLQTTVQAKADTATVTALSGTVSALSDASQQYMEHTEAALDDKADVSAFNALSGTVTGLQTSKADKSYVDTQLAEKASTQTVSDLSDDVSDLQTGLASKIGDVQVNGTSIVTDGVAEIPIAASAKLGLVSLQADYGVFGFGVNNRLTITQATSPQIKNGSIDFKPIVPSKQHESTFYGLAKAAGHDEKSRTLPVGTYSEEAKTAIRTMLGLQEMYEWYKNQT